MVASRSAAAGFFVGGLFFLVAAPVEDVPAPLVFLVGIGDFLADDDLVLDDHPRVQRFVPVQKVSLSFIRDVQKDPPSHGNLIPGVDQGIVLVVGILDEATVEAVPGVVRADFGLPDDHIEGSRAFDDHGLAVVGGSDLRTTGGIVFDGNS